MKLLLAILLLSVSRSVNGQVIRGRCAKVPLKENLYVANISGVWYEISRTPNRWENGSCTQITQVAVGNGTGLKMLWEEMFWMRNENNLQYKHAVSVGKPMQGQQASQMEIKFEIPSQEFFMPFYVANTNYDSYMVVYSCFPYTEYAFKGRTFFTELVWIFSRNRTLNPVDNYKMRKMLRDAGVFEIWMESVDQSDCDARYSVVDHRYQLQNEQAADSLK